VTHARLRRILGVLWLAGVGAALYLAMFHSDAVVRRLETATAASIVAGGAVYLLLGCLRGFTLIPVTSLVLVGVVFFPAVPLFVLTLAGILVSSASIYYFAGALHVEELLQQRHARRLDRLRGLLDRHGLPIIIGWSFFPFAPTDLICYLAGVLRIHITTLLIGVGIGEGAISAIYIFLGDFVLRRM
jgi:uncharacterized membrane protein YdjX (TVP38/TMEM64 family)